MRTSLSLSLLALLAACDSPPFCMSSVCGCEGGEQATTRTVHLNPVDWDAYLQDTVDEEEACLHVCLFPEEGDMETVDVCTVLGEDEEGLIEIECEGTAMMYCEGRAPLSRRSRARRAPTSVEAWAGRAARAERDSIVAFRELAAELAALGAPDALVARALAAAVEEAAHTVAMRTLAPTQSLGAMPAARRSDGLLNLALHNAVEGCVGECWAALVALHQAKHAADPAVRAAMAQIAPDEVRHAALAFDVADWLAPRLSAIERRKVSRARAGAIRRLQRCHRLAHPDITARLGLPDAAQASRLADAFASWAGRG